MPKRTLALVVALAALPLAARADDTPRRWYGWEIMLVDAGAFALAYAGGASESDAVTVIALGAFVAGGPVVHVAEGNGGRALLSGALRLGLPLALGAIAGASCDEEDNDEWFGCLAAVGGGALGGAAIAMLVDYVFLAHAPERPPRVQVAVTPRREGGLTVGLGGSF